ncbi:uncharacterized protein DS421_18g604740 [Arachis hypogaea]|nr:uncharacterized protein DS421_18g604740 [Arachis hypogaea]
MAADVSGNLVSLHCHVFFIRPTIVVDNNHFVDQDNQFCSSLQLINAPFPLHFMKFKLILMVFHKLSLSSGPLLLMELTFLLRGVGIDVWIINQKPPELDQVIAVLKEKVFLVLFFRFGIMVHELRD